VSEPRERSALNARDDLLWIADHWTNLRARLRPGGGNALTGIAVNGGEDGVPIDMAISDLIAEIEWNVARHWANVLIDETPPAHGCGGRCHGSPEHKHNNEMCDGQVVPADRCPTPDEPITTQHMPTLLAQVARRYGHFTNDERTLLEFCDDAHDYRERVRKVLERPAPPTYVGPCRVDGCAGELYIGEHRDGGTCRECGTDFTLADQRAYISAKLEERLMTASEIASALTVLDLTVPMGTLKSWIARKRLVEAVPGDGLYRLADARDLAMRRRAS